jgi:hypothetical protein
MPAVPLKLKKTATVLENKVTVEKDGFDLRQETVVAIKVGPTRLDHTDTRLGEVVNDAAKPVRRRNEVGVEDGDEFAFRGLETFFQGAGFIAVAVGAVEVVDGLWVEALRTGRKSGDHGRGDAHSLVSGVVEKLNLEAVSGVIEAAAGVKESVDNELLVEYRQLNGDERKIFFGEGEGRLAGVGLVALVAVVKPDELIAVDAVECQNDHHQEVGDEKAHVEGVPAVHVAESVISVVRFPVMSEPMLRGEEHGERIELAEQGSLRFEKM